MARVMSGLPGMFQTSRRVRVVGCAVLAVVGLTAGPLANMAFAGGRSAVIGLARDVPAGQQITYSDLTPVADTARAGWTVPLTNEPQIVGRRAKTELVAGSLLSSDDLGVFPPTEMDVLALAVKQGQYPPSLTAGEQVGIYLSAQQPEDAAPSTSASTSTGGDGVPPAATGQVVSVSPDADAQDSGAVVVVEVPARQAGAVADAQGASVVELDGAGDTQ
jgi:hypothetical protein